jgi:hypothetical protein
VSIHHAFSESNLQSFQAPSVFAERKRCEGIRKTRSRRHITNRRNNKADPSECFFKAPFRPVMLECLADPWIDFHTRGHPVLSVAVMSPLAMPSALTRRAAAANSN